MNIAICDDEIIMQKTLKNILEICLQLKDIDFNISCFDAGEHFLESKNKVDIIFLDMEMGRISGMETAKEIRKTDQHCIIIFVTAYADFVFQGYEVRALNYILKPFKDEKIKEVLATAIDELNATKDYFLWAKVKGESRKIDLSNTIYFENNRRKITIITLTEHLEFYATFEELMRKLPAFFMRTHQRYIVNLNFIDNLQSDTCRVMDKDIPISRIHRQNVMLALTNITLG